MRDTFGTTFTEFEVAAARRRETIADDRGAGRHQATAEVADDSCDETSRPTRQRSGLGARAGAAAGAH